METIKVNMTPCDEVNTIHASQNDGEAREWEFELHNNGELIDTSNVTEQMFFKAYKGGTEQILPENTSTPTTSPFIGDIKYPQGLLADQEFLYRQSPTEEDGLAKITDIKGNTLVWNQLVQNGNFADSSLWSGQFADVSISNGVADVTLSVKGDYVALRRANLKSVTGHKYFVTATIKCTKKTAVGFYLNGQYAYTTGYDVQANTLTKVSTFINGGTDGGFNIYISRKNELEIGDVVEVSNVMMMDLTKMGLDSITDPSEFDSLFYLPYYDYNAGTMLSFNGTGLKSASEDESKQDTLALPVATYFPTGMKSAGTAYDELTETKAITRLGVIDLGSINWGYVSSAQRFYSINFADVKTNPENVLANICCAYYENSIWAQVQGDATKDKVISVANKNILIRDTAYTDPVAFKNSLNGVYLIFELATPIETSFSTASLVTENAEIPLSNEDGILVGKCTEELSENPGFFDAKIKLSDADGECYSNKIQLHVERSPQ